MDSRETAFKIMKKFAEMKRKGIDLGNIYNSKSLATRVRITF